MLKFQKYGSLFINIDSCYYFFIDFANLMDIEIKRAE